jgi:V/A-type H+/Na+-transporting ATPase subunit I
MLRPVKMVKVGLLGLRDDEERILTILHDLRVAQVEPLPPATMAELGPERGSETLRRIGDETLRFRGLLTALPRVGVPVPRRFDSTADIFAAAATVPIDAEVGELKREDDRLLTEKKGAEDTLRLLEHLSFYPDRLEYLRSPNFLTFYGEAEPEALSELKSALPPSADARFVSGPAGESVSFLVVTRPAGADALSRAAQSRGVRLTALPALSRTVPEEASDLRARLEAITARRAAIAERLTAIAREWYPTVAAIEEALAVENRKAEVLAKLGASRSVFALEAWVPARDVERLKSVLQNATDGRTYFYDVPTHEEPPTMMSNPAGVRRFEFFIRFYSLPQATEWDPTLVFAIVFPIFFGLMLGDWGYGLTILLICVWMIRGFPGARFLPRAGKNFVKLIMGPKGMQQLAWALIPGCLVAIALGFVFDEFFGIHALQALLGITPIADPLRSADVGLLLLIAGYIGLGMVTLGFALGALKEYFHHHVRGTIGKVGGISFAWGIAGFGLQVLHQHAISLPPTPIVLLSYAGLGLGVVLLVIGEGGLGLLSLIDIISHILSYTRLVGILLASVVLAIVIHSISVLAWQGPLGPVVGLVIAALVVLVGQAFNVILGVFEPGIQGARLIFVEHFSKYFSGNGKPFHPFGAARTHTVSSIGPDGQAARGPILQGPPS